MKINSKTKYNKYYQFDKYRKGDNVKLVSIDEAIERAEHTKDITVYTSDNPIRGKMVTMDIGNKEKHTVLWHNEITSCKTYETFQGDDIILKITDADSTDEVLPYRLTKLNEDASVWMHPIFINHA